jgi:uncharacterized protein (DUF1015 family)
MAALTPFRALRPVSSAAARVAAVPYDVVNTTEARALAAGNPLNFLHVSRAEIDLPEGTSPYDDDVYALAARNFEQLKRAAPLLLEDTPRLYVYRLRQSSHSQVGVAGCFSIEDYERDVIRKHEHTRPDKEDDRTRHLLELRAQTGPVFLTYRSRPAVDALIERVIALPPLYDFTAPDGVQHTIWIADSFEEHQLVVAFDAVPALYIADGHHRAASAARARKQLARGTGTHGEWDWFLAVAFPDVQLQILPYNRVVQDLAGLTPDAFLSALGQRFVIKQDGPPSPERRGEVAMFIGGRWHTVVLREAQVGTRSSDRLDVTRLQDAVLAPLLRIGDVRTDKRIDFVGGARGAAELESRVRSGAAVAFSLYPVDVQDLMAITDAGGIMPPKSTWFEPKLRDGLLSHLV